MCATCVSAYGCQKRVVAPGFPETEIQMGVNHHVHNKIEPGCAARASSALNH